MPSTARRWRLILLSCVLATFGLAACGDDDDTDGGSAASSSTVAQAEAASIPTVTVSTTQTAGDDGSTRFGFDIAQDLTAGPTQINLRNDTDAPHHVQLFRLDDGASMEQVQAALDAGDVGALLGTGSFVGGTGVVDPGAESSADALIDLAEGDYVLLCFIEDDNGVPHLALGMAEPFSVAAATGEVAAMPEPDATIEMVDFGFDSAELPTSGVVEVVNASDTQAHEMNLLRLAEGASAADAISFFEGEPAGPPPFASVGGMQALMPKGSQLLVLEDLEPGDYVMICHIPDPADGVPHARKGMAMGATVS